jgi:DNA-binding transcriptional ArsR family regulator
VQASRLEACTHTCDRVVALEVAADPGGGVAAAGRPGADRRPGDLAGSGLPVGVAGPDEVPAIPMKPADLGKVVAARPQVRRLWEVSATDLQVEQRLIKALAHPIRMRALTILNRRVASPTEIAQELGEPLGVVSYHVRILEELKCIELVRTTPRRGAIEHHYRAIERAWLSDEQVARIPPSLRRTLSGSVFAQLAEDVSVAGKTQGMDEIRHWMVRLPLVLDDKAWEELDGMLRKVLDRTLELQVEAAGRLVAAGDEAESRATILGLILIEREAEEHTRAKAGKTSRKASGGARVRKPSSARSAK